MKIIKNNIWKSKDWAALLKLKSQLSAPIIETSTDNSLPTLKENTKTQEIPISEKLRKKLLKTNIAILHKAQTEKSFNPQGILLWNCPICKKNFLYSERSSHLNSTHATENTKMQELNVLNARKIPLPIFVRGGSPGLKKRK